MLYRVLAIVGSALALAACTSTTELGDFGKMDIFKTGPVMDTVRFESEPPGAEAKTSNGQSCRTPCALALPSEQPLTVTYTLTGYEPQTQPLEVISTPGEPAHLRPNPVVAELAAMAPPKPVKKKPVRARKPVAKKPVARKPAAAPKPAAAAPPPAAAAPAPIPTFAPPAPAAGSPWPAPPKQ